MSFAICAATEIRERLRRELLYYTIFFMPDKSGNPLALTFASAKANFSTNCLEKSEIKMKIASTYTVIFHTGLVAGCCPFVTSVRRENGKMVSYTMMNFFSNLSAHS